MCLSKKTEKTPEKELKIAFERVAEVLKKMTHEELKTKALGESKSEGGI